jgi:hypothetical protein
MLRELADQGHPLPPDLIGREDFPPRDHHLPRPLPLEEDQRLQQQFPLTDTLESNALRLVRATGIRIGECIALPLDCLQSVNEQQVALHVPLGKLNRVIPGIVVPPDTEWVKRIKFQSKILSHFRGARQRTSVIVATGVLNRAKRNRRSRGLQVVEFAGQH